MSDWEIRIPYYGDPDDVVLFVASAARETMDADDARVVEVIAKDALQRGVLTVGQLLDEYQGLSEAERRQRFDSAREQAGLISATESDKRREDARFESGWQALQPPGPERWSPLQACPACGARPVKDAGAWAEVECEQWWCEEHRAGHEADMEEHQPAIVGLSQTYAPVYSEREAKRLKAWHDERQADEERERELREEHQRRESAALSEVKERYEREAEISVNGIQVHPDGRLVNP